MKFRKKLLKVSFILLAVLLPIVFNSSINATIEERDYLVSYESYQDKVESINQNQILDRVKEDYKSFDMIKISLTNEEAKELRKEDGVIVVPDIPIRLHSDQITWSDVMVDAPLAWDSGFTGKNVKVAVLDSGIADHTELEVAGRWDLVQPSGTARDSLGHGTAVAGIIAAKNNGEGLVGIAPDVELYSVKVIDNTGVGTLSTAMSALDWSMKNKMDIVNLSFGVDYTGLTELEKTYVMDMINAKGNNALNQNLLIVSSAGNDGNSTGVDNISVPARGDGFLAVGAVDSNKNLANFSSIGPSLDVVAPGVEIQTLGLNNSYISGNGTSFSAPHIAGLAALYMEKFPNASARTILNMIMSNTQDLGAPGFDNYYGNGLSYYNPDIEEIVVDTPIVNDMMNGQLVISGYNKTNARITYQVDNGIIYRKIVSQNSDFSFALNTPLITGQVVTVVGLDADYNRSEEVVKTVLPKVVPIPEVNDIEGGDTTITGKSFETGTIEVKLPNGNTLSKSVTAGSTFSITTPALIVGDTISVVSIDTNGLKSSQVIKTTIAKTITSPEINDVIDGDNKVNGYSYSEGTIILSLEDGTEVPKSVLADSNFTIDLTKNFVEGDTLWVNMTDIYLNTASPKQITVQPYRELVQPTINEIKGGENKITGTAYETGLVEVTLPDGNKASSSVTAGLPFTINISPLKVGDNISAVSIDSNGRESAIVNKTVVMRALDEPALNVIYDNENVLKGRSFHTGTITVTFFDGTKYVQNVVAGEDFSININKTLTAGERFTVEGKDAYLNEIPLMDLAVAKSQKNFNGVYNIRSKNSGLLMDVYNGGKEQGTNVIQWAATGGMNQKWKFEKLDTGYYKITSVLNPTFSLDVYNGGTTEGTRVIQWPYHGGINQQWKVTENLDGTVTLISRLSIETQTYYALDVYGGGITPGVNVIQWTSHGRDNQKWYLDNVVQELPETSKDYTGTYSIKSKNSGLYMDVFNGGKTQGVNVIQWGYHGGLNQQWKFEKLSNGYYKVTSALSGMSIDVFNGGTVKGNRVIQWPYHGGSNQQWRIIENSDGSISLMSKLSEDSYNYFILDVFGGGSTAGVDVIQWDGHYGNNQKWLLQEVVK